MNQHATPGGDVKPGPGRNGGEPGREAGGRSRTHALLAERLRFETLLSRLSATFVNLPAEEVDGQIERGLRQIVDFLGVDRSSLAQFSADGGSLWVTHSYTVPGIEPFPRVDLAPLMPWYTERIRRGEVLRFSRLPEELPAEAVHEREYCLRVGFRSHLAIPFTVGATVLGWIGFGSFRREFDWPDHLVRSLRLVGEVFANAVARKRAEEERRRGEERFRHLLESTRAIPWVADAATRRFTYVGPQAAGLFGYPAEDWYAEGFWAAHVLPEDREQALAACRGQSRVLPDFQLDYRMVAADGRVLWIHDVVDVVAGDGGAPRALHGFMIDVTAQRRAEDESRGLREQLARVGRAAMLGEVAASIAHEVNQPLCAIVGNAQAVQRMMAGGHYDPAEVREAMEDIARDGRRASDVIGRIRASLQKSAAARAPLDVNDVVRGVAALLRNETARRGAAVRLELAEGLPPVPGDRVGLQQVLANLIANAAEAMERVPGGERVLAVRSSAGDAGAVVVAVTDAGVGLDPGDAGRVFDPFFTTKPGGMGLGLAICKSIVEAHGGSIAALPNAGPGATVRFTLPGIRTDGGTP